MADNQKVDNNLLGKYTVETLEQAGGVHRQVIHIGSGSSAGTEYTEGATATTITGTAILWEDASDTLRAVSAAKPLPVSGSLSVGDTVVDSTNNGSATAGATSSALVAANANRTGGVDIYNSSTTETMHYNEGGTATTGNMPVRPGERITTKAGFKGAINIIRGGSTNVTVYYVEGVTA